MIESPFTFQCACRFTRPSEFSEATFIPESECGYHASLRKASRPEAAATVRLNKDGTLDEVFADPCQFHLEQMGATHWWIGINAPDKFYHINLHSKAKIGAVIEDEKRHDPSWHASSPQEHSK